MKHVFDSILHNIGVILVGFIFAFFGVMVDSLFMLGNFRSVLSITFGITFLVIGFLLRTWATYYFYKNKMGVIVLHPQNKLITSGPFSFSRNPLYLGGNFFIFFGASLTLGTLIGIMLTIIHLPLVDLMIRREERQLEKSFGKEWIEYKKRVHRWI